VKVCIEEHVVPSFGTIPEGSLWADDSPYIGADNGHLFADVADESPAPVKRKPPTRKFGAKPTDIDVEG